MRFEEGNLIKPHYVNDVDQNTVIRLLQFTTDKARDEERKYYAKFLTDTENRVKSYGQLMQELAKGGLKDDEWKAELRGYLNHEKSMVKYYQDQIKMITQLGPQEIEFPMLGVDLHSRTS